MKIINNKLKINSEIKQVIENKRDLLENYEFDTFFKEAHKELTDIDFSTLCALIYIKFPICLSFMTVIPELFFMELNPEEVSLPEGIISIGHHAFFNCSKLKKLYIPKTLTHVLSSAFGDLPLPKFDVYYDGTMDEMDSILIMYNNDRLKSATWHCK